MSAILTANYALHETKRMCCEDGNFNKIGFVKCSQEFCLTSDSDTKLVARTTLKNAVWLLVVVKSSNWNCELKKSFVMIEVTSCRDCAWINSHCTSGSFCSTKSLTVTKHTEFQSMPSLAQINLKKACMKNELRCAKQHLLQYEYDCKCYRYSLMVTSAPVKQLHVTS